VDATFADHSLRRCYESQKEGILRWGPKIGRRYIDRVNRLYAVDAANELSAFPELRFHPLGGDRKGDYALDLDKAWRLIITFTNKAMTVVCVKEVINHYGD